MNVNTLNPTGTALYTMEKAIKLYRKHCQKNIDSNFSNITVDQCLLLICLRKRPDLNQMQLANLIFKDKASVTRILNLLVKKDYVNKIQDLKDKRKHKLEISSTGEELLTHLEPIFLLNRQQALNNFTNDEKNILETLLMKIIKNCGGA